MLYASCHPTDAQAAAVVALVVALALVVVLVLALVFLLLLVALRRRRSHLVHQPHLRSPNERMCHSRRASYSTRRTTTYGAP